MSGNRTEGADPHREHLWTEIDPSPDSTRRAST